MVLDGVVLDGVVLDAVVLDGGVYALAENERRLRKRRFESRCGASIVYRFINT